MDTVGGVVMEPGCLPSNFECQPDCRKRTMPPQPQSDENKRQRMNIIHDLVQKGTEIPITEVISSRREMWLLGANISTVDTSSASEQIAMKKLKLAASKGSLKSKPGNDDVAAADAKSLDEPMCYSPSQAEPNTNSDIIEPIKTANTSTDDITEKNKLEPTFADEPPTSVADTQMFKVNERRPSLREDTKSGNNNPKKLRRKDETYLKQLTEKLTQILGSAQFCGICLSTEGDVDSVSDQFEVVAEGRTHNLTLSYILRFASRMTKDMANSKICKSCTEMLVRSYLFMRTAQEIAHMLKSHVDDNDLDRKKYIQKCINKCAGFQRIPIDIHKKDNFDTIKEDKDMKVDENKVIMDQDDNVQGIEENIKKLTVEDKNDDDSKDEEKDNIGEAIPTQPCKYAFMHKEETDFNQDIDCNFCLKRFLKKQNWAAHKVLYPCDKCDLTFYTSEAVSMHRAEAHCNKIYECDVCQKKFLYKRNLASHKVVHNMGDS